MRLIERLIDHGVTLGTFWYYLLTLERHDVIQECRPMIVSDCQASISKREESKESFVPQYVPWLPSVNHSIQYTYDAFVCYNQDDPEDQRFVETLIEELEGRRGLRLYVPGRDALSYASEHIHNAEQIERRCRRMIIVMSRSFLQSPINDFQERYAQAVRRERLIPIIREEGVVVPRIHQGRDTYDLTKTDIEETWDRLKRALRAPIEPELYLRLSSHQDLRDLRFPMPADDNDQTRLKEVTHSRNVQTPGLREASTQFRSETSQNMRTDLQKLLKTRKTSTDVPLLPGETRKINELATVTDIETPNEKEDETKPKQVARKEDNPDDKTPSQPEYQNQPTTTLTQNPTPSQSDDPNSSYETPQTAEDQTSRTKLNQPLTFESFSNDQRTEVSYSENAQLQEPEDRVGEMGSNKEDKSPYP